MKDSGVEWIGKIPEHWATNKLKTICNIKGRVGWRGYTVDDLTLEGPLTLGPTHITKNNKVDLSKPVHLSRQKYEESPEIQIEKNDIILASVGNTIGKVAIIREDMGDATINPNLIILKNCSINSVFLYYQLLSNHTQDFLQVESFSSSAQPAITQSDLGNLNVIIPPVLEQEEISKFLELKTEKIDNDVQINQRLIELLKEKRLSLIKQVVTKGFDPSVPMKDSGVEWIGEIPKDWDSKKISHSFKKIQSGTTPSTLRDDYYDDGKISWITSGDLKDSKIHEVKKQITEKALKEIPQLEIFPENSLLIAMIGATVGKVGINKFPSTANQNCCVLANPIKLDAEFLFYWFIANRDGIISISTGGAQAIMNQKLIKNLLVPSPDLFEQKNIAKFLNSNIPKIDVMISKIKNKIQKLLEYRQLLISNVVFGKIDVTNSS